MKKIVLVLCLVFSWVCNANLDDSFLIKSMEITVEERGTPVVVIVKTDGKALTELALSWRNRMLVVPLDEFIGIRHPILNSVTVTGFSNLNVGNHVNKECDYVMVINLKHGPSEDAWRQIIEQTKFSFCPLEYKKRTRTMRVSAKKQNIYEKLIDENEAIVGAITNVAPSKT